MLRPSGDCTIHDAKRISGGPYNWIKFGFGMCSADAECSFESSADGVQAQSLT